MYLQLSTTNVYLNFVFVNDYILYKLIKRLNLQQQQHREKIHKTLLKTHKNTPHKQTCAASATKKNNKKKRSV